MNEGQGPVPLADAEVAAGIARAARKGRGADRAPTLEQLLAAFGEAEPTEAARRRVGAALEMADVRVKPPLLEAPPGQRVLLQVAGGASGGGRGSGSSRALAGLLALAAVLALAVVVATFAGQGDDDGGTVQDDLPADTVATTAPQGAASGTTPATTTDAGTTAPEEDEGQATTTTETEPAEEDEPTAAERRRAAVERRRRAAAARRVTVRLDASQPTFLCVEDEDGEQLFAATLTGRETFRGDDLRFNLGLGSTTTVTVNGKRYPTSESPTGFRVTRGGVRTLALGERPC